MSDNPESKARPRLPRRGGARPQQRHATFLALGGLLAAGLGMSLLVTAVITGFAPAGVVIVLLIMSAFGLFFGGHYLIWGVWLDRMLATNGAAKPVDFWKRTPPPVEMPPDADFDE